MTAGIGAETNDTAKKLSHTAATTSNLERRSVTMRSDFHARRARESFSRALRKLSWFRNQWAREKDSRPRHSTTSSLLPFWRTSLLLFSARRLFLRRSSSRPWASRMTCPSRCLRKLDPSSSRILASCLSERLVHSCSADSLVCNSYTVNSNGRRRSWPGVRVDALCLTFRFVVKEFDQCGSSGHELCQLLWSTARSGHQSNGSRRACQIMAVKLNYRVFVNSLIRLH